MALRFTLRQLEYFVAVGEEGSIARASDRVNVSSPSISSAISQLEDEFGLSLFVRKHAHGLTLSQAGQQFLTQAKAVLAEASALNRLGGTISGKVQGPLNVGCLLTFAQVVLPSLRRQFQDAYPDVEVRQFELDPLEIVQGLRSAKIDVALTYDLDLPPDLEFLPLRQLPPYAMVGAGHELADHSDVSVSNLAKLPMVLLDLPLSTDYFLSFFDDLKLRPIIAERTRDIAVMRSMVANGFGYAIGNMRPREDIAPDGRQLRFIPLAGPVKPIRLGLLLPVGAQNVLTVRAFVDHAKQVMDAWNYPGEAIP